MTQYIVEYSAKRETCPEGVPTQITLKTGDMCKIDYTVRRDSISYDEIQKMISMTTGILPTINLTVVGRILTVDDYKITLDTSSTFRTNIQNMNIDQIIDIEIVNLEDCLIILEELKKEDILPVEKIQHGYYSLKRKL